VSSWAAPSLEASQAFYRNVLGLSPASASTFSDARGPEVFCIELASVAVAPRPRVATDLGIYRLALLTDDLDHDYDALTTAGVSPYSPPATLDMGPGLPSLRALFFPDPDGTTFELIEQPFPAHRLDQMRWLQERSSLPIVADESAVTVDDLDALVGVCQGVQCQAREVRRDRAGPADAGPQLRSSASRRSLAAWRRRPSASRPRRQSHRWPIGSISMAICCSRTIRTRV